MLPGVEDGVFGNRTGAIAPGLGVEAGPAAQRVHQPRLAAGLRPHEVERLRGERLSGLPGVLGEQRAHLGLREVAEAQRRGPNVERAAAGDRRLLGACVDAVVTDVPHPAQHDALRKASRALVVAGPQLSEHRDQSVADERVDLVDEQHQRGRIGFAPAGQRLAEGGMRAGFRQDVGPAFVQERITLYARTRGNLIQDSAYGVSHLFARGLSGLDVHVHAAEVASLAAVQQVPEREQGGGLARLPGRVQHEVTLGLDQPQDLGEVHPCERRDAVVLRRDDGTFGVEEAHGASMASGALDSETASASRSARKSLATRCVSLHDLNR